MTAGGRGGRKHTCMQRERVEGMARGALRRSGHGWDVRGNHAPWPCPSVAAFSPTHPTRLRAPPPPPPPLSCLACHVAEGVALVAGQAVLLLCHLLGVPSC